MGTDLGDRDRAGGDEHAEHGGRRDARPDRDGTAIASLFYKPTPPRGVGMACASGNVYSYAEVKVTGTSVAVSLKDASGATVREATGGACGPYVFKTRSYFSAPSAALRRLSGMEERLVRFRPRAILIVLGIILAGVVLIEIVRRAGRPDLDLRCDLPCAGAQPGGRGPAAARRRAARTRRHDRLRRRDPRDCRLGRHDHPDHRRPGERLRRRGARLRRGPGPRDAAGSASSSASIRSSDGFARRSPRAAPPGCSASPERRSQSPRAWSAVIAGRIAFLTLFMLLERPMWVERHSLLPVEKQPRLVQGRLRHLPDDRRLRPAPWRSA